MADGDARVARMGARVSAPVRVAVRGRRGAGVSTVRRALAAAGVPVADEGDVTVLVVAEVLKPEDRAMLSAWAAAARPAVVVLNKADTAGSGPGGPMATARRRAAALQGLAAVPVRPFAALLVTATLTPELTAALGALAAEPADLSSADAFLAAHHRVPVAVRAELLSRLDRFGIAHATVALGNGLDASELPAVWRGLSGIDGVAAAVHAAGAPVRYRRIIGAVAELRALGSERVERFLASDDTVIALMAAAVEVVQAAGVTVDPGTGRSAHLCRARHWRRYRDGPVDALHRRCADDIVRGSLRLLDAAGPGR